MKRFVFFLVVPIFLGLVSCESPAKKSSKRTVTTMACGYNWRGDSTELVTVSVLKYDENNRVTSSDLFYSVFDSYKILPYYMNGESNSVINGKNFSTEVQDHSESVYDSAGRTVFFKTRRIENGTLKMREFYSAYDKNGNLVSSRSVESFGMRRETIAKLKHDSLGRLTEETTNSGSNEYQIRFTYNSSGKSEMHSYGPQYATRKVYDSNDSLVLTVSYDLDYKSRTLKASDSVVYHRNNAGRVDTLISFWKLGDDSTFKVRDLDIYKWKDGVLKEHYSASSIMGPHTCKYEYDSTGRCVRRNYYKGKKLTVYEKLTYDENGDLVQVIAYNAEKKPIDKTVFVIEYTD
jgi:hypothetical protein